MKMWGRFSLFVLFFLLCASNGQNLYSDIEVRLFLFGRTGGQVARVYPALLAGRQLREMLPPGSTVKVYGKPGDIQPVTVRYALYPLRIAENGDYVIDVSGGNFASDGWRQSALVHGFPVYTKDGRPLVRQFPVAPLLPFEQVVIFSSWFLLFEVFLGLLLLFALGVPLARGDAVWGASSAFLLGKVLLAATLWIMLLVGLEFSLPNGCLFLGLLILGLGASAWRRNQREPVAKCPSAAFSPCSLVRLPNRKPPRSLVEALHLDILQQAQREPLAEPAVRPPTKSTASVDPWRLLANFCLAFVVIAVFLAPVLTPMVDWDSLSKWVLKAKVICHERQLIFDYTHQNYYPLLWPVSLAWQILVCRGLTDQTVPLTSAALFLAFMAQLWRGLKEVGVKGFYRPLSLAAFVLLFFYVPIGPGQVYPNFVYSNPENFFLGLTALALVLLLRWFKFPEQKGFLSAALVAVLGLSLLKMEGAVTSVIILGMVLWQSWAHVVVRDKKLIVGAALSSIVLPVAWVFWVKAHGYYDGIHHMSSPVTLEKIFLIGSLTLFFIWTTRGLLVFMLLFALATIGWRQEKTAEEKFLLKVFLALSVFVVVSTLGWSEAWIRQMYQEGFNRIFLHAAPALVFYLGSRFCGQRRISDDAKG